MHVAPGFHLKVGQCRKELAVLLEHGGSDGVARAIHGKKIEERGVAEILLNVCAAVQVFFINFGDRQTVTAEMAGEGEERSVFFAYVVQNAYCRLIAAGKANDFAA